MASLRARVVRRGLVAAVELVRRRRGEAPDPNAPAAQLEEYALNAREEFERIGSRLSAYRRVDWREIPEMGTVGGEWVEDAVATAGDRWRSGEKAGPRARSAEDRIVLHLHGGAYLMGSPRTHRGMAASLSRTTRSPVVVPEYRLAPEHVFPAALDDAMGAYRWLVEDLGFAPQRVAVTGDSAGGGLALSLLVRLRDEGMALPACYAGMSPWTDLAGTGPNMSELDALDPWLSAAMMAPVSRAYAGETPLDDPWLSPLYADLTGLPPMLVHVGNHEILLDDARRTVERAREVGVDASLGVFEEMWHVFHAFPGLPETKAALREIGAFVRRHTQWCAARDAA